MKDFILFIHQLPQNIVGFFLSLGKKDVKTYTTMNGDENVKVYFTNNCFGCGVSLGKYIILDTKYLKFSDYYQLETVSHEHGHQIQSRKLGWAYLFTVGIVSATRNCIDRWFHKSWSNKKRIKWYYSSWPECEADKNGGVKRNF